MPTLTERKPPNLYEKGHDHAWEVARMRRNVGGRDRALRLGVGGAAAITALTADGPIMTAVLALIGLAALATGATGYCPVSRALGRDTYHKKA